MNRLSKRERDIAALVMHPNKVIAQRLNITEGTVKSYLNSIYKKLQLNNRVQLAILHHQHQQKQG